MEEEELHIVKDVKMDVCGESMNYGAGGRPGKRGNLCLRSTNREYRYILFTVHHGMYWPSFRCR